VAAILRFHTLYEAYGLKAWAKKLYNGLEVKPNRCTGCGNCETKCPFKLPIQNKLQKAQYDLQSF
jgi:predicted aldo/keto reductase-like oxidoreductase